MNAILLRVGADCTLAGGNFNPPCDPKTKEFVYVPIPEFGKIVPKFNKPYSMMEKELKRFKSKLPFNLENASMHLDPDFDNMTMGDQGSRGKKLKNLNPGDFIIFYASFKPIEIKSKELVYALIGLFEVKKKPEKITEIDKKDYDTNAHTRVVFKKDVDDIVVFGNKKNSGRFSKYIEIGEKIKGIYRVKKDILNKWGGLNVKDGYIHRSANPPFFENPEKFFSWLNKHSFNLIKSNWGDK